MANIPALAASVNNLYLGNGNTTRFHRSEKVAVFRKRIGISKKEKCSDFCSQNVPGARVYPVALSWRLFAATELHAVQEITSKNSYVQNQVSSIEIPVTCYQIIGVHEKSEKDEIVKSVIHLKSAEIEEGYSDDAVTSRQNILMDVRDKLLFEPEYAGNSKDKQPPRSSLRLPWPWLPGALCLLQEAGEEKLVLEIGRRALQHPDSKPFVHDLLLSMALAECEIAKVGFEKNNISQGFEALARAQCLLRSKISLGKLMLLSQIEESLEELAPACTLDLLGMPRMPENSERRLGAIAALRELLRQGLAVETSCQVEDWPCFLNQALKKLMATEIVELISWENLALSRKNRKSLESQHQRNVIDFNSFYTVLLAHIALGFSSKQTELVNKARSICECLMGSEGIDLKFEEAFCSFLLGQIDEVAAVEKLMQLEKNSSPNPKKSLQMKEGTDVPSTNKPLEKWLKEAVLGLFPDTRDNSASLAEFFNGERRASDKGQSKKAPPILSNIRHRPLVHEESTESFRSTVKQLAPNIQSPLVVDKGIIGSSSSSTQLKRSLGTKHGEVWWGVLGKVIYAIALGFIVVPLFKLIKWQIWRPANQFRWNINKLSDSLNHRPVEQNGSLKKFNKVLSLVKLLHSGEHSENLHTASLSSGILPSTYRQMMPHKDAEALVKRWQLVKAEALGPSHDMHALVDVLEGQMLVRWQGLAEAAKEKSCFWRFVLLELKIVRAEILKDMEMGEIEVMVEEAAELVDESQPKNPTYYSPYKIRYLLKRQDDGSWRFYEADILI